MRLKQNNYTEQTLVFPLLALFILLLIPQLGCKKLIEVDAPYTSSNAANVYASDATAVAVLTGIYARMSREPLTFGDIKSISLLSGLSSDELTLYSGITDERLIGYYRNELTGANIGSNIWGSTYQFLYIANAAIEDLTKANALTPAVKQQLLGEAKFIRAFCYFYLVNLYGDVPLVLATDYLVSATLPRAPKTEVWKQIIGDLKEARDLLGTEFLDATLLRDTPERVRPTKWAASALLARCYLYTGDWINAEAEATEVINNGSLFDLDTLGNVFLANSIEAIWQLQPVNATFTEEARTFIIPESGPGGEYWPAYLSKNLLKSFEAGDLRKTIWTDSVRVNANTYYYPYKYKTNDVNAPVTEYSMVLRLAEQYLIRAEARAQQENLQGATDDVNEIRTRAGLPNIVAANKADILTAILHEKRIELFTEWGHRWLDLKRSGTVDAVMSQVTPQKGGTWSSNWQWYPISNGELEKAPNVEQNAGYR